MLKKSDTGDFYGDSSAQFLKDGLDDMNDSLKELYGAGRFAATALGTVQNTTAESALIGSGIKSLSVPSSFWENVGKMLELELWGIYSTKASASGTLRLRLKLGSTLLADSGAQTLVDGQTNKLWHYSAVISPYAIGAAGQLWVQSIFEHMENNSWVGWPMGNAAAIDPIDLTSALAVSVTAQFSVADADNKIICTNARLGNPILLESA